MLMQKYVKLLTYFFEEILKCQRRQHERYINCIEVKRLSLFRHLFSCAAGIILIGEVLNYEIRRSYHIGFFGKCQANKQNVFQFAEGN